MAIYTVHVPDEATDPVTEADQTVFVREGFSARAFLFGLLYLIWHRLWFAAVAWVVGVMILGTIGIVLHPPGFFLVALFGLMHLYLGIEGPDLRRWSLGRRNHTMLDLVSASGLTEAEAIFFGRHTSQPAPQPPPRSPRRWAPVAATPAVIGMFPDGGGP